MVSDPRFSPIFMCSLGRYIGSRAVLRERLDQPPAIADSSTGFIVSRSDRKAESVIKSSSLYRLETVSTMIDVLVSVRTQLKYRLSGWTLYIRCYVKQSSVKYDGSDERQDGLRVRTGV